MKIAVCDDDKGCLDSMKRLLAGYPGISRTEYYQNLSQLSEALENGMGYDLVLMDIEWEGNEQDGIAYAAQYNARSPQTRFIFVTAYNDKFSEKIFWEKVNLCGFLVKPVRKEHLEKLLDKVREKIFSSEALILQHGGITEKIANSQIRYIESNAHQLLIHTISGEVALYEKLDVYEKKLHKDFLRVHKSFLLYEGNAMICYIMCILLWIAYLWLDCMVVAYAFEPRRDSVRQAGIILGLMAAQLPAAALKFLFNDNVLVRYGAMIAVGIVTVAYAAVFLKGTIGQKVLFMLCEYLTALLAEMLSIGILNKYMEQKPQLSYYTPTMVLLLSVVLTVTAIFFLIFLVVWKKIVEKESFDVSIIIVFSVFPVSQLLMITAINEQVFRNMTLYTGWILAAAILGSVADGVLLYTLLRQQQLQELKLRLSEVQSTWEMARNHYHEIENRREEFAKIRHDMRNQQMVLQELLHQGEYEKAEKMLETLTDTVAATTEYLYCGDPVFNAIMGETEKACREKRIAFQYDLEIPQKLKLDPVAICSILSNLTRNAVAAAEMTEREEAFLSVKAAVKGDYLHICVENSRAKKLPGRPGRKGYGLEILHDLVERNHGQIDVQPGEGSFRVDVTVENF